MRWASRLAALGLLLLAFGATWIALGMPLLDRLADQREALAAERRLLQRYAGLAATEPALRAAADRAADAATLGPWLLPGDSEAQALAGLQQRLKSVLAASSTPVLAMQPLPPKPAGSFRRVGLRLQFHGDSVALQQLLHAVEAELPLIIVDQLQIASRGAGAESVDALDVTLDLSGFIAGAGT